MSSPSIADKYTLLRKLGQGGMAEVYLARQEGLQGFQKLVVIKRILPHRAEDGEFVTMFLDEARTAADLRHPNIVNVFDINRDEGTYYMAMEFLHGHDMRALMKAQAKRKENVPTEHALQIVLGAAAGLDYAHNKSGLDGRQLRIVHRDVSPQNLIVGFSGEVKVVDFGIAKAASAMTQTQAGVVKGKFAYMAPEQTRGDPLDHRADQFALGAILWEVLTLRRLFKRRSEQATMIAVLEEDIPSVRMFRPDLPEELASIVARTLERDPERRFPDCGALRMALEDYLAAARVPHSQARLGEYMRGLFAESIEDEAGLSAPQLDDADSDDAHKDSQSSLPPPDDTRQERRGSRSSGPKKLEATRASTPRSLAEASSAEEETRTTTVPTPRVRAGDAGLRRADVPARPRRVGPSPLALAARSPAVRWAALGLLVLVVVAGAAAGGTHLLGRLQKGTVIVRTEPKGASMSVDSEALPETTPHILKLPAGQPVKLSLSLEGYETVVEIIDVPAGEEPAELHFELVRER